MKNHTLNNLRLPAEFPCFGTSKFCLAAALMLFLGVAVVPAGTVTLTASDAVGTSSFSLPGHWDSAAAPSPGNAYFTSAFTLRTTNATTTGVTATFAGDSLSVDYGGRFIGKFGNAQNISASGTITVSNLTLNGGYMDQAGGGAGTGDSNYMAVAGSVIVNSFSGIGAAGATSPYYETLEFLAPISGSANLQQGGANAVWPGLATETGLVKLSAANPYSGTYTIPNTGSGANPPSALNRMLQLNNLNALSNATLNLTINNEANPVSFAAGVNTNAFNLGALSGSTSEVLSDTAGGAVSLSVGGNNASTAYTGVLSGNGSLSKVGTGTLTLSGASTYSGGTIVSAGTLLLNNISGSGTGSGAVSVSGSSAVLGGSGIISGATVISNSAALTPQPGGSGGTILTFGGNLTITNASANFNLSSSATGGGNDEVVGVAKLTVDHTVTFNVTASGGLDQSSDYTLISSVSLNTGAGGTPVLVVNGVTSDQVTLGNYKLLLSAGGVVLHYISATAPVVNSAIFSPNPQAHNGNSTLTVLVTPTAGHTISSISVTTDNLGGTGDATSLTRKDANGAGLQETWVGMFNVPSSEAPGSYAVGGTVIQSDSFTAAFSANLLVATNTYVWNGNATPANSNWSANNNWAGGAAPGVGDSVDFSGNQGLSPVMDQSYSLAALTFDSLATASFTIAGGNTLTLSATNAIANNSSSPQTVNVPVSLTAAATISATGGNLTLGGNVDNGGNLLTVAGANNTVISGELSDSGGLTKIGNGALTLSGTDSYAGATTIAAGAVSIGGSGSLSNSSAMTVAGAAGNTAMLTVGGNLTVNTLAVGGGGDITDLGGGAGAGAGAVYQTNGTLTLLLSPTAPSDAIFILGGNGSQGTAGYGYYKLSGGTLNGTTINIGGRVNQGLGVMDLLSGGTVQPNGSLPIGRGNGAGQPGYGVLNVAGGSVGFTGVVNPNSGGDSQLMLGYRGGLSELNISGGGSVTLSPTNVLGWGWGMDLMRLAGGSTSVVNLNAGGTLTVPLITASNPANGTNISLLNFNGGTLRADVTNSGGAFLASANITAVTVYSGGVTVDNNGTAITISNPLTAPSGNGVQTIVVSNGGSNYIGAPLVQITGGTAIGGAVATAVANMIADGSGTTFKVGSISLTSPGSYSVAPTGVSLIGNSGATAAVAGIGTVAANTSGGLTALGSGTLTLAGANTYTGNTTVNAGTLKVANLSFATNSTITIAAGAVLQLMPLATNTVAGLILNGVSQPAGIYNSTTGSPYITGLGSLSVGTPVATNPTNILTSVKNGNLVLSWPADHLGWHLQVQTNSSSKGLGTNWVDMPATAAASSFTNAMNPGNGAVFYRLTYP